MTDDYFQTDLFAEPPALSEITKPVPGLAIEPINEQRRALVIERTTQFCHLAESLYRLRLPDLRVNFDLSGATAGLFEVHGSAVRVRYNPWIFAKFFQDSLDNTVPHEVAHFVVHQRYRRRMKPHGSQWRQVMADFGADPAVTFHYDLTGIPTRRQRAHRYLCGCREHDVSTTRHNRVQRGQAQYNCVICAGRLEYAPLQID